MSAAQLMLDDRAVGAFFAKRAAGVDAAEIDVRDGLRWLAQRGLLGLDLDWRERAAGHGLESIGELILQVAERCLASAFALWCQRMVIEYIGAAVEPDFPAERFLPRLLTADLLGSPALGNGMAHLVLGVPLTVRLERRSDCIVLDGSIAWASNIVADPDAAITVAAAVDAAGRSYVVALPLDARGVKVAAYPRLLALQATRSTSVLLEHVRVPANLVLSPLDSCLPRVRPILLVLQSCFCAGVARAALAGVSANLRDSLDAFLAGDLERLAKELTDLEGRVHAQLRNPDTRHIPMRAFLETRLAAAQLAAAASRLEMKTRGGRAYRLEDPANRRLREAAFLAIQAPTEAQLEWELARGQ